MALHIQTIRAHLPLPPLATSKPMSPLSFPLPPPVLRLPPKSLLKKTPPFALSPVSESTLVELTPTKPFPSQVSRTILELSSHGTLSTLTQDGWPLGVGVRFAVDPDGTPVLCLNEADGHFSRDGRSALHVQLRQSGLRTPQCTIQGSLCKPEDAVLSRRLRSAWTKRFGSDVGEDQLFYIDVERVLQIEDFGEVGTWVNSSEYRSASPDPLRDCAERIVDEINSNNIEDIHRFCNVYVDLDFQVLEAKMIWVDRLGFDLRIYSPPKGTFDVRIPFPREVTDEKGAKSSFNCMSQLAWEVEKNFYVPDFEKVERLKQIS
ncbi:hypothetical protein MLD38_004962 [Melastoma candidum]|uniref:Uncharacterized protein n=1 Tax=Melastoma candidum TaxID=119954 RepID=A0ACB9S7H1_9MYRT|nr:hypothetical protein MLD38_004962 [Melastoma candidum]